MSDLPWWRGVAGVATTFACSGTVHEVRWEEGHLVLADHDDIGAERALRALGGTLPACLELRGAWDRHAGDPALVTLGRRPSEPSLGFDRLHRRRAEGRRDDLLLLFSMPAPFLDRLVLGAIAAAAAAWPDPGFRRQHGLRLGAGLAARATPALRRFAGDLAGPEEALVVHCTPAGSSVPPTVLVERTDEALEVTASLPVAWLAVVWGAGLAEPDGRFVLALREQAADGSFAVDLGRWAPSGVGQWEARPEPGTVRRTADGAWRVVD